MNPSLYIHIPFCQSKCFYCSFSSFEKKDDLIGPYLDALDKEASGYKGQSVGTVYIGGGTPTYLSPLNIRTLFEIIRSNFVIEDGAEITMEANPATFDAQKAKAIFDLGVNRMSLGVQSLNDKYLEFLGRPHTRVQAISSFETLRDAGFKNINLDLIYSLPGQTRKEIEEDVFGLASFGSEHISLYTLSICEGSHFYLRNIEPPTNVKQGDEYLFVSQSLGRQGFFHYEVSNFAKQGYPCRHNLNYWRGGNYIGLGVAAHSHLNGHRYWNGATIETYLDIMKEKPRATEGQEKLTQEERFMETLLIGLRLAEGVDVSDLEQRFEVILPKEKKAVIYDLIEHGLLSQDKLRLKATLSGMVVLDEICSRLI
jgi:oxygen-independent coproporphyrinogen-3 oxidase